MDYFGVCKEIKKYVKIKNVDSMDILKYLNENSQSYFKYYYSKKEVVEYMINEICNDLKLKVLGTFKKVFKELNTTRIFMKIDEDIYFSFDIYKRKDDFGKFDWVISSFNIFYEIPEKTRKINFC